MRDGSNGGSQSPSNRNSDVGGEVRAVHSTTGGDAAGRLGFDAVGSTEEAARVLSADRSVETSVPDNMDESMVLKVNEVGDGSGGALENQPSSSVSRGHDNGRKKTDSRSEKSEHRKVKNSVVDYDSVLSEFDQFAAKGVGEAVGYGYEIGDMVWGKVKSHPWWPGHIYNEAFASPTVRKTKHEGLVLVAFFGDGSYGWFDPAELIPFEENFPEKSRQMSSRSFVKAVDEAVDELSRRRGSGLACRCRNEFNFWPSSVEGYYVVDVGDYEPGVYSLSQIKKARESFQPRQMLSFVQQLALAPMSDQHWTVEFLKNKATVLACRKALYEEFDETYAQAFGTVPVRPPRPTAPVTVDPSKAPLSGRLVVAETLGKGKHFVRPTKTKDQLEKDKYLFKRRDEPIHTKTKKTSSGQVGRPACPLLIDGSGLSGIVMDSGIKGNMPQTYVPGITGSQHQPTNDQTSIATGIKPTEGSSKLVEGGIKKAKVQKRQAGELSAENAALVQKKRKKETNIERPARELGAENVIRVEKKKKKKKEIKSKASADLVQLPLVNSNSGAAVEKTSGVLHDVPLRTANSQLENQKDGVVASSSSPAEAQRADDDRKLELPMLVRDLRALALNPFHGVERNCPATAQMVFLKYRSLVYQKSLVSLLPENETNEARSIAFSASSALGGPADKTNDMSTMKLVKPSFRLDDPTKGGKKRGPGPSDRPEAIKKKKLNDSEDVNKKKKLVDSEDIKKKKKKIIQDSKLLPLEKKIPQKSTESQRGDVKEISNKNVLPTLPKGVKTESSKRNEAPARANPTMLVMKFPQGAALPSGAELRAKFARFGPLDHSATRVFWKSYTCRLVYQQKVDAQAALTFALGNNILFGNANVRCHIKPVEPEQVEPEPVKVQIPDASATVPQSRESVIEQRTASKSAVQPLQQSVQLKSCLKKPSNEDGSNGNGRGTRVKFILGGEGSSNTKIEQEVSSSFAEGASSSSYTHSMDVSTKNSPKFIPQSNAPSTTHHLQFQKYPINMPSAELQPRSSSAQQMPTNDISQQLLNLLTRCSDVVNNLTGVLGYVPYHPL